MEKLKLERPFHPLTLVLLNMSKYYFIKGLGICMFLMCQSECKCSH